MKYSGSCHCGGVAFEVEGDIYGALDCNCSIFVRRGALLWFVPRDQMTVLTPEEHLGSYSFNKHVIRHRFCRTCGIHTHGEGRDPKGNEMAAINLRCIEDIDLAAIPVQQYDGRSA